MIGRVLEGDEQAAPIDAKAFGRWMLRRAPQKGVSFLADAFARGAAEAGGVLSLHYKGARDWQRAVAVWERMMSESRSMFAASSLPNTMNIASAIFRLLLPFSTLLQAGISPIPHASGKSCCGDVKGCSENLPDVDPLNGRGLMESLVFTKTVSQNSRMLLRSTR